MTAVLTDESGENKQDTIIPVPAPVKKSATDFSCFMIPYIHDSTSSFKSYYLKNNVQSKAIFTLHCIYSYAKIL